MGTFRIVFSEDEFPIALSNLSETYAPLSPPRKPQPPGRDYVALDLL